MRCKRSIYKQKKHRREGRCWYSFKTPIISYGMLLLFFSTKNRTFQCGSQFLCRWNDYLSFLDCTCSVCLRHFLQYLFSGKVEPPACFLSCSLFLLNAVTYPKALHSLHFKPTCCRGPFFLLAILTFFSFQTGIISNEWPCVNTPVKMLEPPQGFEPWTYGLQNRRSNQLS